MKVKKEDIPKTTFRTCYRHYEFLVMLFGVTNVKVYLEGVNRCKTNLMTNDAELKINCNTLSVAKECSRIPGEGLWTISSKLF